MEVWIIIVSGTAVPMVTRASIGRWRGQLGKLKAVVVSVVGERMGEE
jgi:hypothetical protein